MRLSSLISLAAFTLLASASPIGDDIQWSKTVQKRATPWVDQGYIEPNTWSEIHIAYGALVDPKTGLEVRIKYNPSTNVITYVTENPITKTTATMILDYKTGILSFKEYHHDTGHTENFIHFPDRHENTGGGYATHGNSHH